MNRRLGGDVSLNTLVHADEAGEVQDLLVDPASSPEAVYAERQEAKQRRQALADALEALTRESAAYLKRDSCPNHRLGWRI
jgi:RNA polymerase sigma-32 factor